MMNQPDFNKEAIRLVTSKMQEKRMSQAELARLLSVGPSTVHHMLNGQTLMVGKLQQLSLIFEYNFFTVLSDLLDLPIPAKQKTAEVDHSACNERIHELEIENRTLLKILKADK